MIIATRARVSISVNPSPIWCSVRLPLDPQDLTGYGPSKYVLNRTSDFRGTGDAAEHLSERASLNVYHTSSLAARLLLSTFSASAVGIIRQIRQYVRRYVRNQTRVK